MSTFEKYGRFLDDEGCFELINEPPRKWLNVHFNQVGDNELYAEVSNLGDGPITIRNREGESVQLVSYDATYTYIRDDKTNIVFCPWGAPAPQEVENKSCRYYPGKTVISSFCVGLTVSERIFVPKSIPVMISTISIQNNTDFEREISVFQYAMFQLSGCNNEGGGVWKDNYAEVKPEVNGVFITNRNKHNPSDRFKGYLMSLQPFYGGSGYRDNFTRSDFSLGTPKILWGWNADNKPGVGPDCTGLVQVKVTIPPKDSKRVDFILGQACSINDAINVRELLSEEEIDLLCEEQVNSERKKMNAFKVKTGNAHYDSIMNTFVKTQMYSYMIYKSGFRDNLQLDNAYAMVDYKVSEENLLRALSSQMPNGQVPHGFRPLNRQQYSDKPAWIMLTVPGLIYESGDLSLLEKKVSYFESNDTGTVWDHMLRAMRFLCNDLGIHGLCDQHHADWNDGLEATQEAGNRESVMVTQQLAYGLLQVEHLALKIGDTVVAKEAREQWNIFNKRLNELCWDGEWYVRSICGDGYKIGSDSNKEGKIFINSQSWAVLSHTANEKRATMCMNSLETMLGKDLGYQLCAPAFSEYDPRIGRMSNSLPGTAENGGCYCHGAGFKAVADCILGRAENAWDTFVKVAPDNPLNPIEKSYVEPYCFTNFYTTTDLVYGRSGYPWKTGTAAWMSILLIEWILGARRHLDGLLIDPCLTKRIPYAEVSRKFRGAHYDILLDNSAGRCKGTTKIVVDGKTIAGNILPDFKVGSHLVEVTI
jgi:cellobiose phosphorylase